MLNFALNACFEKFFSLNRISIKKYFDEGIFCPNRLMTKQIFHCFSFLTNRLAKKKDFHSVIFLAQSFGKKKYFRSVTFLTNRLTKKIIFRLSNFLPDQLSKRISNQLSKKSYSLMWGKIKISVSLFFVGSIGANFYKSIAQLFVQVNKRQRKYFGHMIFLPSECTEKEQNDYRKKLNKIVLLNDLNAHYFI